MNRPATKEVFRKVMEALIADLVPAYADRVERYDGEPEVAINEHVAELNGVRGTSILVGFTVKDVAGRQANQQPHLLRIPVTVLIVRRRGGYGENQADCEALDDAMDATWNAFESYRRSPGDFLASAVAPQSMLDLRGYDTWLGRAVQVDLLVNNIP